MTELTGGWSAPDPGVLPGVTAPPRAAALSSYGEATASRRLVPLRPLATGEILDGAVTVTRAFPRTVLAFAAGVAVVSSLLDLLITLTLVGPVSTSSAELTSSSAAVNELIGSAALATGLNLLVSLVTQAVMVGVMTAVVGRAVFGRQATLREAWHDLRPILARLVGLSLLVSLAVYGSLAVGVGLFVLLAQVGPAGALLGLPLLAVGAAAAVWLYVRWSLAPAALVLEKQGVRAALRRGSVLARRSFWRLLGILLLALVIALTVSLVLQVPFQLFGHSPFDALSENYQLTTQDAVVGAVSGAFAATLVAPFSAGVRALLYVDRRMRAEGLDVSLVAASRGR